MLTVPNLRLVAVDDEPPPVQPDVCIYCGGTGWVRYAVEYGHVDFGKARSCPSCHGADRLQLERCWRVSDLRPDDSAAPSLRAFTAHDAASRHMLAAARSFADTPCGWLTLHGNGKGRNERGDGRWGAGKSHLGEAITRSLLARNVPALFITAPRLMTYAGAVYREPGDDTDYERRLQWLIDLPVLVVDEINKESRSEATERLRLQLFDARYVAAVREQGGATVLLSNDRPESWADPALASRAMDGRFTHVEVTPVDFRQAEW